MSLKNDLFLRALLKQPIDRTPCWMMRQAGRYLPEYRATRAKAGSFMQLCQTPELACEVTLQPLLRFDFDAAILFSDILTVPDAMGLELSFHEGEGPRFAKPLRNEKDILQLPVPDPEQELRYVMDAVRLIRHSLDNQVPLIGFSGSPWTLATYMVEGQSSKEFSHIKKLMYTSPLLLEKLLETLAQAVTLYLNAQIKAGAQAVQIFDTWGGVLTPEQFQRFSLNYMQQIIAGLIKEHEGKPVPVIVFTKGGGNWLTQLAHIGANALGLDWMTNIQQARQQVGDKVALQGNMDPGVLYATPEVIEAEVTKILADFGHGSGHVFNLGHGIHPGIDPENVAAFVNAVRNISPQYHQMR